MTADRSVNGALHGIRVIEIAQGWAGPMVGTIFADFGAEVLKVESVQRPDWWRGFGRTSNDDGYAFERSWNFNFINRNKADITLNLASETGRDLLLRFVAAADVFVENFTSHVTEQLRLTHDALSVVNPSLISVSIPGYGSSGSWRDYPAVGTTIESMCGVQSLTGYVGGGPRLQASSWDPVIGLYAAFAAMGALRHRHATGKGQRVEISHIEAGTHSVAGPIIDYELTGVVPERHGNSHKLYAPHGCYPTLGVDEWITFVARNDLEWEGIQRALGSPLALDRVPFRTAAARLSNQTDLDERLAQETRHHAKQTLFEALQREGVPAAPVNSAVDLLADPHLAARRFFKSMEREHVGAHLYPSRFFDLHRRPSKFERPAPHLGEDNADVLQSVLGLSPEELSKLEQEGVIGRRPV